MVDTEVAKEQFGAVEILHQNTVKMMIDFHGGNIVVHGNGAHIGILLPNSIRMEIVVTQNQVSTIVLKSLTNSYYSNIFLNTFYLFIYNNLPIHFQHLDQVVAAIMDLKLETVIVMIMQTMLNVVGMMGTVVVTM